MQEWSQVLMSTMPDLKQK